MSDMPSVTYLLQVTQVSPWYLYKMPGTGDHRGAHLTFRGHPLTVIG